MEVMTTHDFFDCDIEKVLWNGHKDNRELVLDKSNSGAIIINKKDIIAFAKEFDLVVFEKSSKL